MSTDNLIHNTKVLHELYQDLTSVSTPKPKMRKTSIALAAAKILGEVDPYLQGIKKIDGDKVKQIKKEYENSKEAQEERLGRLALKSNKLMTLLEKLRNRDILEPELASKIDDYYQLMGCFVSYIKYQEGDLIPGPDPRLPEYRVHKIITNERGLYLTVLIPIRPHADAHPIFCCRGTTHNHHNYLDDLENSIGQYGIEPSKDDILKVLREVCREHGPSVLTGHSLGGAVGATLVSEFCQFTHPDIEELPLIKALYQYNAPGVGKDRAQMYKTKLAQIPETRHPKIYAYRHAADIISLAGKNHLRANQKVDVASIDVINLFGSLYRGTFFRESHSFDHRFVSEFPQYEIKGKNSLLKRIFQIFAEIIRLIVSFIFRPFVTREIETLKKRHLEANKLRPLLV